MVFGWIRQSETRCLARCAVATIATAVALFFGTRGLDTPSWALLLVAGAFLVDGLRHLDKQP